MRKWTSILAGFWRDTRGVTAVEFAMVILPFFAMVLGIVEISRALSIQGSLTRATDEAMRDVLICRIRIDKLSAAEIEAELQQALNESAGLGGAGTAKVTIEEGGNYVFTSRIPFHFVVPLFDNADIDLSVTRPLVDTCSED